MYEQKIVFAESELRRRQYASTAPKHHWSGRYAAKIIARLNGRSPDEAAKDAVRHIEAARTKCRPEVLVACALPRIL